MFTCEIGGVKMKLSEKIQILRKENGYSQESLAEICNVSRQSISKWEAGIALPETEKLIILSSTFHVSVDVLIKDDLTVNGIKDVYACGVNAVKEKETAIFEGTLIKESIEDENILDYITVNKVELWNTGGKPKYWTVLFFTSTKPNFPQLISKVMIADIDRGGNWFVDFKSDNIKYIVFKDKVLKYEIGNKIEKNKVCDECRQMGIVDEQMYWSE